MEMTEGDCYGVGSVQDHVPFGEAEQDAHHVLHLFFGRRAGSDNRFLHFSRGILGGRDILGDGSEEGNTAGMTQLER
jgi:hypothetical protein